jgi:type I restriction enzyme M protein
MLPTQLFYNTGIPACLWFLSRYKNGNKNYNCKGEVLFIDASELGYMVNRSSRAFTDDETSKISHTYHEWKKIPSPGSSQGEGDNSDRNWGYRDVKGFCKSATLADIAKHNALLYMVVAENDAP